MKFTTKAMMHVISDDDSFIH